MIVLNYCKGRELGPGPDKSLFAPNKSPQTGGSTIDCNRDLQLIALFLLYGGLRGAQRWTASPFSEESSREIIFRDDN